MKPKTTFAAVASLLAVTFAAQAAAEQTYGKRVVEADAVAESRAGSFDVYVDGPTGFAFVNTPQGWKFVRKIEDAPAVSADNGAVATPRS